MIYLVIKAAAYTHYVAGAFTDPDEAKKHAKELADTCVDSHHRYEVQPMPINKLLESEMEWSGHSFKEPEILGSYTKKHKEIECAAIPTTNPKALTTPPPPKTSHKWIEGCYKEEIEGKGN